MLLAAALTHVLPSGEYQRRDDPATGWQVVVAGTYQRVEAAPVGPFPAFVSIPRGIVAGAEVIALVLLVGGAWTVVDKAGTLGVAAGAPFGKWLRFAGPIVLILAAVGTAGILIGLGA